MKGLIRAAAGALGYEIHKKQNASALREFTIDGVRFLVDPCSVGKTPQGQQTAAGAIRYVQERRLRDLRVLDICCGVGIIGLLIFQRLRDEAVREIAFADINIFNLNSLRRTLAANGLESLLGSRVHYWLSDGLAGLPPHEKFDLIVSNPPHFFRTDHVSDALAPDTLGTYDAGWIFHDAFYRRCHEHLTDRGEVWFLENGEGASEADLLPFITAHPQLQYVGKADEPLLPGCFWMFTRKVVPVGEVLGIHSEPPTGDFLPR